MSKSHASKKAMVARKRKVGESSNVALISCLDTWFNDEKYKSDYVAVFGNKNIILPKHIIGYSKYIGVQYFKDEGFSFPSMLEYQGLTKFMELSGVFYPNLVKVFYTTVRATLEGHLTANANGKKIVIDDDVWEKVARLTCAGIRRFEEEPNGYSKISTYQSMMLEPNAQLRSRSGVGGLTIEDRMLEYLITYVFIPRARNHA